MWLCKINDILSNTIVSSSEWIVFINRWGGNDKDGSNNGTPHKECPLCAIDQRFEPNNVAGQKNGVDYTCKDAQDYSNKPQYGETCDDLKGKWASRCCVADVSML